MAAAVPPQTLIHRGISCGTRSSSASPRPTRCPRGTAAAKISRSWRILAMAADDQAAAAAAGDRVFGVLFVCLGNICRSPTAEAVFSHIVQRRDLSSRFKIDSAGTIDYHEGDPADARMKAAALKRGIALTSMSRPIKPSDFEEFDLILAMDKKNRTDILRAFSGWNKKDGKEKVQLMCSYCKRNKETEVPDPYYGGPAGFEKVLNLLEDACEGLLDSILTSASHGQK